MVERPDQRANCHYGRGTYRAERKFAAEFRQALLEGRSGVTAYETRYFGPTLAGVCNFDELRYQKRKEVRRGTRAGGIGIFCAHEAVADSGLDWENVDRSTVGIYVGVTEHGNVETENEIYLLKGYDYDTQYWSHHHNPRTVANNPAGEISLNLGITGPHYTLGAACAAGNAGIIQGVQMLRLGDCDVALCGGVSESIHTFGIFASFHSQGALAKHDDPAEGVAALRSRSQRHRGGRRGLHVRARTADRRPRPRGEDLRRDRRLRDEQRRHRFRPARPRPPGRVHPLGVAPGGDGPGGDRHRQHARHGHHLGRRPGMPGPAAGVGPATAATRCSTTPRVSSATRWARPAPWNWPAICPPSTTASATPRSISTGPIPQCELPGLVANQPREAGRIDAILNNSFGMLGINSVVIVRIASSAWKTQVAEHRS